MDQRTSRANAAASRQPEPVMPCPKEDVWLGGKEKKDSGKNKQPAVIVPPLYPFPAVETHGNGSVVVLNMSDIRSGQEQKERATKNGKDSGRSEETSTSASIQSSLVWTWPNALIYAGANSGNSSNDDDNDGDNDDEGRGDIVSGRRPYQAPSPRVQAIFDHVLKKETLGRLVIVTDTLYHGDASGFAAYENVPRACGRPLVTVGLSCAPGEHIARLGHRAATATAFHRAQAEAEQRPGPTPLSAAEHQRMRDAVWAMHDVGSATERRPYRFCALPKRRMRPSHQQRAVQNHFWRRNRSSSSGSGSGSDGNRNSSSSNRSPMEGPSTPTLMAAPLDVTDLTAREAAECILRYACEVGAFGDPAAEKRAAEKEAGKAPP